MRRILAIFVLSVAGCSTAPVADFLDAVAPGRPELRMRPNDEPLPPRRPRNPANDPIPHTDEPPPLPPAPAGFRPPDPDDEGQSPPARLRDRD